MTAQILSADLTIIIQETKKKNPDIRTAAEQSLHDLKALPTTSEAQLAADLRRRPHFINPFVTACKGRLLKATIPAVSCLHRLIVSNGLPKERLTDVLEAFQECVGSGLDVQLKILQSLPSLLQGYGDALEGDLQFIVLQLCTALQQVKNSAVSSTASATLQQTVSSLYDKVEAEDENAEDIAPIEGVTVRNESVPVRPAAFDAYRILTDICLITEGRPPRFLVHATLSPSFGLELIEMLLLNHAEVFGNHTEQSGLLLTLVMPLINRSLSERHPFGVTVRAVRLLCILIREHLETVHTECEVAFGLLNHVIETEAHQSWRRALCMETFRLLYSNSELLIDVYSRFDAAVNRRNIIQDNLSLFVRLASEKPGLIGLGSHSTAPVTQSASQDQAVLEAENAAGMIGGDFGVHEKNVPGISNEWSTMRVPCLDQLDKADGPPVPETYIYSLVLNCINQLSDVLAKVVLPVAMHQGKSRRSKSSPTRADTDGNVQQQERPSSSHTSKLSRHPSSRSNRSRSIPTNPLELEVSAAYTPVKTVAAIVANCWPAVLATSTTFFNAALDADFYRSLVRSFQKFTQVAGILRLGTPRDALLTTLSKIAVPSSFVSVDSGAFSPSTLAGSSGASARFIGLANPKFESFTPSATSETPTRSRRPSLDLPTQTLSQRNLMCLRALVHLAIALGPILDSAWSIVLDSVQKAHVLLSVSRNVATAQDYRSNQSQGESQAGVPTLSSEISAVESAVSRLFSSSNDYPQQPFKTLLTALCNLLRSDTTEAAKTRPSPSPSNLAAPAKLQRRIPSVSGLATTAAIQPEYSHFAIARLGETAKANLSRLTTSSDEGWALIMTTLNDVAVSTDADDKTRKMAADVIAHIVIEACIFTATAEDHVRRIVQDRSFGALKATTDALCYSHGASQSNVDLDVFQSVLDALHSILEHCGDAVITGWELIYSVVGSIYRPPKPFGDHVIDHEQQEYNAQPLSAKLARSSFASLQLICSDFLEILPESNILPLVNLLAQFGSQSIDINISLTVVTQFLNISDFLQRQMQHFDLAIDDTKSSIGNATNARESISAVWLHLQQHLAALTADQRADIRNGSIHIIYRNLDSCADLMSESALTTYFHKVLFRMMRLDSIRQKNRNAEETNQDLAKAFNNSSVIVMDGCAKAFKIRIRSLVNAPGFDTMWQALLDVLDIYLEADSYDLSRTVFVTLTKILSRAAGPRELPKDAVSKVAALWARDIPRTANKSEDDAADQESAFVAYVKCVQEIYGQSQPEITSSQVELILKRLKECLAECKAAPYTSDIDRPTSLQNEVLESCLMLSDRPRADFNSAVKQLASFVRLPYEQIVQAPGMAQPSFVAFAKRTMDILLDLIAQRKVDEGVYDDDALMMVLENLTESVRGKYTWRTQGKEPTLWRKATTTVLSVLASALSGSAKVPLPHWGNDGKLWQVIMKAANAILQAEYQQQPPDDVLILDETFDLDAAQSCRSLLTPALDSLSDAGCVQAKFIDMLFTSSALHNSPFDDLDEPPSTLIQRGLSQFHDVRLGRTYDPSFNPRVRICYFCLDELFSLATAATLRTTGGIIVKRDRALLAPLAMPVLIIRCAMPLMRYIADQPLRGRMPTPMSQRLELLHILGRVQELYEIESDKVRLHFDTVAPGWPGILPALAPLISQARELAGEDRELAGALGKAVGLNLALAR